MSIALRINLHVTHPRKPARVVVFIHTLAVFGSFGVSELGEEFVWTLKGSGDRSEVARGETEREEVVEGERDEMKLPLESHQGKRVFVGSDGYHCIATPVSEGVNRGLSNDKLA